MLPQGLQKDLERFIQTQELDERVAKLVNSQAEPLLRFTLAGEEDYVCTGNSRVAGCPDLPPSFEWPLDSDGEYWTFIAQINLDELPITPYAGLPLRGILYFFLGLDEPAYDIEHRIYYYDADLTVLKKTAPPDGREEISEENRGFVSHKISFEPDWTLPEEAMDTLMEDFPDAYDALENGGDTFWGQHQSWAGDTPLDAYLCRNGMQDILFSHHKTADQIRLEAREAEERGSLEYAQRLLTQAIPQLEEYNRNKGRHKTRTANWHVLLSISSLDEVGMCWWDAGYVEFLIDKSDLECLDFSRTYVNLATS
ncbi:DUF1963 domain-containing protein [Paenibacillus sp. IHBB 10380]|uniref:DUF1963 domain-containing protein n=1 Tax=Paenibacillus sp. IHBB 10380 TaxID=1566358 RepID=UPI0005CFAF53|nr:YwqG family protein [Paenibacillus sp. IHBB 10380]AJS59567.1 hypothetical protein UB51_15070 [Paenibacillus sp. IHBB 10380]